jgi:hypothetical protein
MKKFLLTLTMAVALATTAAFALPGVTPYVADTSGEYVYYKDTSFKRISYVGFLYYDDSTYAVRYYAPANVALSAPAKDITLYVTINKDSTHLEFTGENITGVTEQDDTDVVNYMHDLFYELTARRQNVTVSGTAKTTVSADFAQFGGSVTMTYSALVPIFNLYAITASDGSVLLQTQTTGLLTGSGDKGFTSFTGIDNLPKDKVRSFKKKLFAKQNTITFENQSVTIDNSWTPSLDNLWLLGDSALLMLDVIPASANDTFFTELVRKSCQSAEDSYAVWPQSTVIEGKATTKIVNLYFQPNSKDITRDFILISKRNDGSYNFFKLTVFDSIYQKNKKYFDKIIESVK